MHGCSPGCRSFPFGSHVPCQRAPDDRFLTVGRDATGILTSAVAHFSAAGRRLWGYHRIDERTLSSGIPDADACANGEGVTRSTCCRPAPEDCPERSGRSWRSCSWPFFSRPSRRAPANSPYLAGRRRGSIRGKGPTRGRPRSGTTSIRNFAASLSWINEGHLEEHKRDGFAVQGWGRVPLLDNRLSIGIGAGIYQYFDTKLLPAGTT